ncbi:hypothetical protein PVK06_002209 [Gossypium arboreum]|uniref:Uncharacterized protein n=1 Tax=Gossypium arboreum TaxID=29729 RepID=A0ABR0R350_GOSAR|nr:hypothetical protein PVK06_002209 [Gossypium arboreum]
MMKLCSTFHLQTVMAHFDDQRIIQFCLSGLVHQLKVSEFRTALGLYTKEFRDENDLGTLHRHIHYSPSKCWEALTPALPPTILAAPRHRLSLHL